KPCAREPHARFDGRELETEQRSDQGHGDEGHQGKPCGHQRLRDLPSMRVTAPALDPPTSPQSPQTTNPGSTTPGQQLDNASTMKYELPSFWYMRILIRWAVRCLDYLTVRSKPMYSAASSGLAKSRVRSSRWTM